MVTKEFREKVSVAFSAALVPCLTLFFFGPLYLYFSNVQEWPFLISRSWYFLLVIAFGLSAVITLLIVFLKPRAFGIATILLLTIGFLVWFQGNILIWDYGVLDGRQIDWSKYATRGYVDTLVWLIFFAIAYWKREWIYKNVKSVALALLLIQSITVAVAFFQAPEEPEWKKYTVDKDAQFNFSKQRNVIILVLDTFQSDIFQELIDENPEWRNDFSGFTYFRNAIGGFPTTYPSIPLILTGEYYDNSTPIREFLKSVYSTRSIPVTLKQNGYQVELYGSPRTDFCPNDAKKVPPALDGTIVKQVQGLVVAALFRHVPHIVKKHLHDFTNRNVLDPLTRSNLDFVINASRLCKATNDKPLFKLFHIAGAHPPFRINENLEVVNLNYDLPGYKSQAAGALTIARIFLKALRDIGVYDNSLIFIIGDHGGGFFDNYETRIKEDGTMQIGKAPKLVSDRIIKAGIPLMLVKPFGSKGEMKVSDAPVSLSDIPKTIVSELGISEVYPGRSVFEVGSSEIRPRRFLYYRWEHEYWEKEFLPDMEEYIITGFSWSSQSWMPTYRKFTPQGVQISEPPIYEYGTEITFGEGGNAQYYQGAGWSFPEKGFTWTDGRDASLLIPVKASKSDLILRAMLFPLLGQSVKQQRVSIYINGAKVDQWTVDTGGVYGTVVPRELVKNSSLGILFDLPDAISPKELNINEDQRQLAIALRSLTLIEPPIYKYGSEIRFGKGGNAHHYQVYGWSGPEEGFTWTEGLNASLLIPVETPDTDLVLKAKVSPFISNNLTNQRVIISVSDGKLGEWNVTTNGGYEIKIPKKYITGSSLLLRFELPDACSPAQLGVSEDRRRLGIAFQSIVIYR